MEFISDKKLNFLFEIFSKTEIQKNLYISEVEFKQLNIKKINKNINMNEIEQIKILR